MFNNNKNNIRSKLINQVKQKEQNIITKEKEEIIITKPNIFTPNMFANQNNIICNNQPQFFKAPQCLQQQQPKLLEKKIKNMNDMETCLNFKNDNNFENSFDNNSTVLNTKLNNCINLKKIKKLENKGFNEKYDFHKIISVDELIKESGDFYNVFECDSIDQFSIIDFNKYFPNSDSKNLLLKGDNNNNNSIFSQYFIASTLHKFSLSSKIILFDDHIMINDSIKVKLNADFSNYRMYFFRILSNFNKIFSNNFSSVESLISFINNLKRTPPEEVLSFSRFISIYYRLVIINFIKHNDGMLLNVISFKDKKDFKIKFLDCNSDYFNKNSEIILSILNKALNTSFYEKLLNKDEAKKVTEGFKFLKDKDQLILIVPNNN